MASPGAKRAAEHRWYFEDLPLGRSTETPALTVTEAHVALFTGATGAASGPGGSGVPDLLPLCISSGLAWRVPQPPLVVLAFMGCEWRFLAPVNVGDTIRSRATTVTKRALREGGVVVEERDIVNQRGEVVQKGRFTLLVARRPAG